MSRLDDTLALILQGASDYHLRELLAAGREEQRSEERSATRHLRPVPPLSARSWHARALADRAEVELGAREAIRAGSESCPLRDEPVGVTA